MKMFYETSYKFKQNSSLIQAFSDYWKLLGLQEFIRGETLLPAEQVLEHIRVQT